MYLIALFNVLIILYPTTTLCSQLGVGFLLHHIVRRRPFFSGDGNPYSSAYAAFATLLRVFFVERMHQQIR